MSADQGWTCPACHSYVPNGVAHSCWTSPNPPLQSTPGELRIAGALERIAAALERLAASGEVRP